MKLKINSISPAYCIETDKAGIKVKLQFGSTLYESVYTLDKINVDQFIKELIRQDKSKDRNEKSNNQILESIATYVAAFEKAIKRDLEFRYPYDYKESPIVPLLIDFVPLDIMFVTKAA